MIRYRITHQTTYDYADAVPICHNLVHLIPRALPHQWVESAEILVQPEASHRSQRIDYFGNTTDYLGIELPHRRLQITSQSVIGIDSHLRTPHTDDQPWETVAKRLADGDVREWYEAYQYILPSPRVSILPEALRYARPSFPPGRGVIAGSIDLMHRIKRDFTFDTRASDVYTTTSEIFRMRRGVCQDFAHLQIACLRALGLAARYVSGYLRTYPPPGKPRLVGADASHAWLAVFAGPGCWVELDPTNDCLPSTDHIVVAYGRDFADVSPIDGVFIGGGDHTLTVSVDVAPLDESND